ncbi:MAG: ABC transporter ATP-binding protein, partial [Alphaproteobacteria bacterium]
LRHSSGGRIQTRSRTLFVEALRAISFTAEEGDRIGVIGLNGAGKSTLLRAIAGIFQPTGGQLRVTGRVAPLLALGVGMYDDASGWENIRNCGLQHGMSSAEIAAKQNEIAAFTELGDYLHLPLYTYSSGMRMRLSYAVATAMDSEILVLDEVASTGDISFQEKAQQRFTDMVSRTKIVFLATHDIGWMRKICSKVILLSEGRLLEFGPAADVLEIYINCDGRLGT